MIELPPEFEADIQGQNLNLFPIVTIETLDPDRSSATDSGVDLQGPMWENNIAFAHDGGWDVFYVGDYVKIDDEYMRVTDTTFGNANVTRGLFGSDIAYHDDGTDVYLVVVGEFLSTRDVILDNIHYKPLLLNIPSIKESMDFENRKYKISNVTLKVSNFEYEGERFSDYVGNLINIRVGISWVSQSESILLIYDGFIRRYSHDDETVTLQLEDSSQKDLHKDVPTARLGDGDEILDKYKNRPTPMVYGEVEKSPCVVGELALYDDGQISSDDINIITDNDTSVTIVGNNPLYAYKDTYIKLLEIADTMFDYEGATQYEIDGNIVVLKAFFEGGESGGSGNEEEDDLEVIPSNTISDNSIIGYELVTPFGVTPLRIKSATAWSSGDWWYSALLGTQPIQGTPDSPTSDGLFRVIGTMFLEWDLDNWEGQSALPDGGDIWWDRIENPAYQREGALVGFTAKMPIVGSSSYIDHLGKIRTHFKNWFEDRSSWNLHWFGALKYTTSFGGNAAGDVGYLADEIVVGSGDGTDDFGLIGEHNSYNGTDLPIQVNHPSELLFHCRNDIARGGSFSSCVIEFYNLELDHYMLLDNMLKLDFYTHVNGRIDATYG